MITERIAWLYLFMSGLIDVAWALSMKKADGFRNPEWTTLSIREHNSSF